MFRFSHVGNDITIGPLSLPSLIQKIQTPFYLYDLDGLDAMLKIVHAFMKDNPHVLVCYAVKANPDREICKRMIHASLGLDVVSGGEILHMKRLGAVSEHMFFSGVGKTIKEIDLAITEKIGGFNIESLAELKMIQKRAQALKTSTRVGIRWNPNTPVDTHRNLKTGGSEDKFGLETPQVWKALEFISASKELTLSGLHVHIGSQILDLTTFKTFFENAKRFAQELSKKGHHIDYLNIGGGLGIFYDQRIDQSEPLLFKYLKMITDVFAKTPYRVVTELGRALVAIYGVLMSRVLYPKQGTRKNFLICDASMTELMRPVLYKAVHPIWIHQSSKTPNQKTYELTSPICESGDVFDENFRPTFEPNYGDVLMILGSGAYGASMANQYNLRPLPLAKYIVNNTLK